VIYETEWVQSTAPWGRSILIPRGFERGSGCKWAEIGEKLYMHSPDAISDQRLVKLADHHAEKVSGAARTQLLKFASDGRNVRTSDDLSRVIYQLARTPVAGKYNPLLPSKARQRFEFRLGPILVTEDVIVPPATTSFTDNFNRTADLAGSTLSGGGATWTQNTGSTNSTNGSGFRITQGDNNYATSADLDTDNAYATSNLTSLADNSYGWIWIRANGTNTNGYEGGFGINNAFEMYRYGGGTYPLLDSDTWTPVAALLTLTADGSSLSFVEGATNVTLTATNSSESTGAGNRRGGIGGFSDVGGGAGGVVFNDYTYADIVVGGDTLFAQALT
jgi:hypothetical protein